MILTCDFPHSLVDQMRNSAPSLDITFVSVDDLLPASVPRQSVFSRAAVGRLFAPHLERVTSDRVVYLDSDMLVRADLAPLFEAELDGHPVGAVVDSAMPQVAVPNGLQCWSKLGIAPTTPYFNSGMLVFDRAQWVESGLATQVLTFIADHPEVLWPDQDGLNAVLRGGFASLAPRWNATSTLRDPLHLGYLAWDVDEVATAVSDPAIVHFTARPKPWQRGATDSMAPLWWQELEGTPFAGLAPSHLPWWREAKRRVGLAVRG